MTEPAEFVISRGRARLESQVHQRLERTVLCPRGQTHGTAATTTVAIRCSRRSCRARQSRARGRRSTRPPQHTSRAHASQVHVVAGGGTEGREKHTGWTTSLHAAHARTLISPDLPCISSHASCVCVIDLLYISCISRACIS